MNVKKVLPILLLVIMAVAAIYLRQRNNYSDKGNVQYERKTSSRSQTPHAGNTTSIDRTTNNLFFTKHAKCRMKCRHITQQEVKDILVNGTVNYNKSDLNDPRGATYAIEGVTSDRQHVRIIFAPKQQHLTVVTVIDLEEEFACNCD